MIKCRTNHVDRFFVHVDKETAKAAGVGDRSFVVEYSFTGRLEDYPLWLERHTGDRVDAALAAAEKALHQHFGRAIACATSSSTSPCSHQPSR